MTKKEERAACTSCQHRRALPGTVHIRCGHTGVKESRNQELLAVWGYPDLGLMGQAGVTCQVHGLRSGWFGWPWNFDPVWLLTCAWYAPEEKEVGSPADRREDEEIQHELRTNYEEN